MNLEQKRNSPGFSRNIHLPEGVHLPWMQAGWDYTVKKRLAVVRGQVPRFLMLLSFVTHTRMTNKDQENPCSLPACAQTRWCVHHRQACAFCTSLITIWQYTALFPLCIVICSFSSVSPSSWSFILIFYHSLHNKQGFMVCLEEALFLISCKRL